MTSLDSAPQPLAPQAAPAGEAIRIDYVPRPGLLKLSLVNALLGILTLTIYRFWARTNTRRHIWSCVHINGQPLEYTGKGSELFKGALIVFGVLGVPILALVAAANIAYGPDHPAVGGIQTLIYLIVALLWGAAIFRARRYQLSRTLWRGIRGSLEGSAITYSLTYFGSLLAWGLSLGWSTPVMNVNLQEQLVGGMRFGSLPFSFKGRAGPLYPSYALCWFLTLGLIIVGIVLLGAGIAATFGDNLTQVFGDLFGGQNEPNEQQTQNLAMVFVGIIGLFLLYTVISPMVWALYTARELSAFASYTSIGTARFRLDATPAASSGWRWATSCSGT